MNKKIASEISVGVILILAVVIGGIFWMQNKKTPFQSTQKSTDQSGSVAQKEVAQVKTIETVTIPEQKKFDEISCDESIQCGETCHYNGELYTTKKLAGACWMTKNINSTTQPDGVTLSNRYCYGDDANVCNTDGGMYTWADALGLPSDCNFKKCDVEKNEQGICPNGWHIGTEVEWKNLTNKYSYASLIAGGASGFNALLTGYRNDYIGGMYSYKGDVSGHYWSSTQYDVVQARYTSFYAESPETREFRLKDPVAYAKNPETGNFSVYHSKNPKTFGASVRCIKN